MGFVFYPCSPPSLPVAAAAELSCLFFVLLLAVPEVVSSLTKTRSKSAVQSIPSLSPRCPRGSLVPYQSEEHQFCGALLTERVVCGMLYSALFGIPHTVLSVRRAPGWYIASGHPLLAKPGPGGTDSPRFGMGRDCLLDSEEQHRK